MSEKFYVTEKKVAEVTGRALSTIRNDRCRGKGVPYVKIGRSVRYCLQDVYDFMETRKIHTGDEDLP